MNNITTYKFGLSPYSNASLFLDQDHIFVKIGNNIYRFCALVNETLKMDKKSVNSWYIVPDNSTENAEIEDDEECFTSFIASLVSYNQLKDFSANVIIQGIEEGTKILVMLQDIGSKYYITLKDGIYYMTSSDCTYSPNTLPQGTDKCEIFTLNKNTEEKFFNITRDFLSYAPKIVNASLSNLFDTQNNNQNEKLFWLATGGVFCALLLFIGLICFAKKEEAEDNYELVERSEVLTGSSLDSNNLDIF